LYRKTYNIGFIEAKESVDDIEIIEIKIDLEKS
jgi:hypothetical protein